MKVYCPRCGKVGYLGRMKVKGYVYYYVVHRDDGKWYSHYIGKPNCLRVPVTLGPRDHLSIAPFFGGKKFMLKYLAMFVPPHEVYVEVFGGMAAFLLNKPRSKLEVYNDIDGDLVNVFKVIRDHWEEFVERYMWLIPSRQLYIEMRDKWLRGEKPEDPIERAVWFVFLHRLAYGGSLIKGYAGTRSQISRCVIPQSMINVRSMISRSLIPSGFVGDKRVASRDQLRNDTERALRNWIKRIHSRLSRVVIENLDYRECIRKYDSPETWFYLDPPYLGYKGGYVHGDWSEKDYEELHRILRSVKGKWIMNHADHPYIRELFREFYIIEVECIRSTKRVKKGGKREKYTELLIANYPLQH